ncbi:MAG: ATP-grasp domain-containing protein [Bdellovibrionota bacterium]
MNFLIVGDPIRDLKPKTDTSLALVREALMRAHTVHWCTQEDLTLWDGRILARVENLTGCAEHSHPASETEKELQAVNSYDGVWIRKDPPFDVSYMSLCWLLALEENNVPFLNKPSLLLRYHEKMLPIEAVEKGFLRTEEVIPTFLPTGRRLPVPTNFPKGECVTKPWLGHGGVGVEKLEGPRTPEPYHFLQPLQKEVTRTGDRRIFLLNGEIIGSFARMPAEGDIRANLAAGGRGVLRDMSKKEAEIANRLGDYLKEIGIVFAGADMIGEKISEVNITSPTGFQTFHEIGGRRLAPLYLNYAEEMV